jgi:hypothetical protein
VEDEGVAPGGDRPHQRTVAEQEAQLAGARQGVCGVCCVYVYAYTRVRVCACGCVSVCVCVRVCGRVTVNLAQQRTTPTHVGSAPRVEKAVGETIRVGKRLAEKKN